MPSPLEFSKVSTKRWDSLRLICAESMMKTIVTLVLLSAVGAAFCGSQSWYRYVNEGWGYSVSYPSYLVEIPFTGDPESPGVWKRKVLESKNKQVTLETGGDYVHPDSGETLDEWWRKETNRRSKGGDEIRYAVKKNNWYVISGVNDKGFEF